MEEFVVRNDLVFVFLVRIEVIFDGIVGGFKSISVWVFFIMFCFDIKFDLVDLKFN